MPDSGQPQVPNYVPGVGRLVTDRFDFEAHILGTNFRHNADAIDVIPGVVVNGQTYNNVLTALKALALATEPPVVALATQSAPGIIQLTRDLSGTNGLSPIVIGLQGRSVSSQQPSTGNVLTWNGTAWIPQSISGLFVPGADLGGSSPTSTNSLQFVSGITGSSGQVNVSASFFVFSSTATPNFSQNEGSGTGAPFYITAQPGGGFGEFSAGNLILSGGQTGAGQLQGGVTLNIGGSFGIPAIQSAQVISGQNVTAFFPSSGLTSTMMPSNTGNGVIYIGNATVNPTTGTPVGGVILYGNNGQLWIKQSDNINFQIGSVPDPNVWNAVTPTSLPPSPTIPNNGTITYNVTTITSANTGTTVLTFAQPTSTSCKFDIIYVAKEVSTGNTAQYKYSIGFVRNGAGSPVAVGTVTSTDSRSIGSWNVPPTSTSSYISGNNIVVITGSSTAVNSQWTIIAQITVTTI